MICVRLVLSFTSERRTFKVSTWAKKHTPVGRWRRVFVDACCPAGGLKPWIATRRRRRRRANCKDEVNTIVANGELMKTNTREQETENTDTSDAARSTRRCDDHVLDASRSNETVESYRVGGQAAVLRFRTARLVRLGTDTPRLPYVEKPMPRT